MPRRLPDYHREPELLQWSDVPRFIWIAFGVALLLGLLSGAVWIAWNLLKIHVLGWGS